MKHLSTLFLGFFISLLASCSSNYQETNSYLTENPTGDDYTSISSLANRHLWQTANVHDPCCIKVADTFYVYHTDAYYRSRGIVFNDDTTVTLGYIPVRKSTDLIHWEFAGWAFDSIPKEAVQHVRNNSDKRGAQNMWAPFVEEHNGQFRLYYSVSRFGRKSSYIGLATSNSPNGPWEQKGCVVKTTKASKMNAIDPTIIDNAENGKQWMLYGSYFGGLYALELNPDTGLPINKDDQGHVVARRIPGGSNVIEAPEVIYNPTTKYYYLFVSYDPLFTFYNIRVGRSQSPEGPYYDYFGQPLTETRENYPVLTHSYQFENHKGWSGNGHCGIVKDGNNFFMMNQARLAPDNRQIVMHVREIKWLPSGWPVVSPERYAGVEKSAIDIKEIIGKWEVISIKPIIKENMDKWEYLPENYNKSSQVQFNADKSIENWNYTQWALKGTNIQFTAANNTTTDAVIFKGWDWENQCYTQLFSGIDKNGFSVWGKQRN